MLSNHMLLDLYALFVSVRRNPLLLPADAYQEIAEMLDTSFDHNAIAWCCGSTFRQSRHHPN